MRLRVKIVGLPDPTSVDSTVSPTGPTTGSLTPTLKVPRLRPVDLPEELIREIIGYLTDYEALKLSTLSKAFYATFPPRPRNVTCKTYLKAISLRDRLTQGVNGGLHLASLEVRCTAFTVADDPIICDILSQARNLHSLVCGPLESGSPKVRNRIQRLPRLSQLQLHKPSTSALTGMVYPQSLSSLHLSQFNGFLSWTDLSKKLSGIACLTRLVLDRCSFRDPELSPGVLDMYGVSEAPSPLLSVTSLEMLITDLPFSLLYFSRMFPSLDSLHTQDSSLPLEDRRHPDDSKSKRVLHKLTYLDPDDPDVYSSSGPFPWKVRHLVVPVLSNDRLHLDAICDTGHLVGLGIRLPRFTVNHWHQRIEKHITNVHILELESFLTIFLVTMQFFTALFAYHHPKKYGELPLQVLSIAAPRSAITYVPEEELHAKLLEKACYGFPNLRYIALANSGYIPRDSTDFGGDRAPWRWWRIIRSGQEVECREIPAWEGERVRKYFRDADRDKAKRFDEEFHALR